MEVMQARMSITVEHMLASTLIRKAWTEQGLLTMYC